MATVLLSLYEIRIRGRTRACTPIFRCDLCCEPVQNERGFSCCAGYNIILLVTFWWELLRHVQPARECCLFCGCSLMTVLLLVSVSAVSRDCVTQQLSLWLHCLMLGQHGYHVVVLGHDCENVVPQVMCLCSCVQRRIELKWHATLNSKACKRCETLTAVNVQP